jgi:hypothetical protein
MMNNNHITIFDELAVNPWNVFVHDWKADREIKRSEVIKLLEGGSIPTKEALPFFVAIISKDNEVKLKGGRPASPITTNFILQIKAVAEVFELANKYRLEANRNRGDEGPLEKAMVEVAREYMVSSRQIEKFIREHKSLVEGIKGAHIK